MAEETDTARETLRVMGLEQRVDEPDAVLRERAAEELGIGVEDLAGFRIAHKALDARRRGGERRLRFVVHADFVLPAGRRSARLARLLRSGRVVAAPEIGRVEVEGVHPSWRAATGARAPRVAVVGSGPAGVFAALVLARNGVPVTLIDRGARLSERGHDVVAFHRTRRPNAESNLLFGEGGAGTYSDGKLYTRVDHPLEVPLLEELVACGAPAEILYDARAHIGTDRLHRVLPRLRSRLEALGVEFHWRTRLERLVLAGDTPRSVRALETSAGELGCDAVVLAPGHSARDTWEALAEQGVPFEAKPFQLGIRVEHPQELVDLGRHGAGPEAALLGAASYSLVCKAGSGLPAVHTFCMCPGGRIVASVNEAEHLCTNGMSNSTHSSRWANAAVVTTLGPREFGSAPFDGVAFQRAVERRFFAAGGADYTAPAQRVPDFLAGRESAGELATSFRFGARPARLDELLPGDATEALRRALERFDHAVPGFAGPEGLLVGVESRSSGPVRIPRDRETYRARGCANLLPVGEGAGYAGGIMSAALDGARAAQALLRTGVRTVGTGPGS